jgi:multidrug resistance efflux pump
MNREGVKRIPMPLALWWRDIRMRMVPGLVFLSAVGSVALLWKGHIAAPSMVGQAEPVLANVSSQKAGVLANLCVNRFQKVKVNDVIATVVTTDPAVLSSSIAVIQADIKMLGASMAQVMRNQRNQLNYAGLRIDWMRQRAELAMAKVRLQEAETEARRMEQLFRDSIVSERKVEDAQAARDALRGQVAELTRLVEEQEKTFPQLSITNSTDFADLSDEAVKAALSMQEAKLRLTEAELSPVTLKAPMDGIITTIFHRSGEAVMAGQPVVAVATLNPVRIVGYLRAPIQSELKTGMEVEVRTRGLRRDFGKAQIIEVGTQLEPLPAAIQGPMKLVSAELALPVDITIPPNLNLRAGELVDLVVQPPKNAGL